MLFSSTFGMTEMELAAEVIWKQKFSSFNTKVTLIGPESFKHDNMLLVGLCQLMCRGWIEPYYPNSCFKPTDAFWERINKKLATLPQEEIEAALKRSYY